jgi:hypothetical protein
MTRRGFLQAFSAAAVGLALVKVTPFVEPMPAAPVLKPISHLGFDYVEFRIDPFNIMRVPWIKAIHHPTFKEDKIVPTSFETVGRINL